MRRSHTLMSTSLGVVKLPNPPRDRRTGQFVTRRQARAAMMVRRAGLLIPAVCFLYVVGYFSLGRVLAFGVLLAILFFVACAVLHALRGPGYKRRKAEVRARAEEAARAKRVEEQMIVAQNEKDALIWKDPVNDVEYCNVCGCLVDVHVDVNGKRISVEKFHHLGQYDVFDEPKQIEPGSQKWSEVAAQAYPATGHAAPAPRAERRPEPPAIPF
jgi:hypothetical protein